MRLCPTVEAALHEYKNLEVSCETGSSVSGFERLLRRWKCRMNELALGDGFLYNDGNVGNTLSQVLRNLRALGYPEMGSLTARDIRFRIATHNPKVLGSYRIRST
jgi:hypothetical protein